jgi:hypothetical protein
MRFLKGRERLLAVLSLAFLAVCCVNPLRETALGDDWTYSLAVKHLVETGRYEWPSWAYPNPVFQTYAGALASMAFGYSVVLMRILALSFAALSLWAFHTLARDSGVKEPSAAYATLGMVAAPIFLLMSVTFNTQIFFLALFTLSIVCYARAFDSGRYSQVCLGSLFATLATLNRQFGAFIVAAFAVAWVLDRRRRTDPVFLLLGVVLPGVAALWQADMGLYQPSQLATYAVQMQRDYLSNIGPVVGNVIWRVTVVFQYLAFFSLPFVPFVLLSATRTIQQSKWRVWIGLGLLTFCATFLVYARVMNYPVLMPILPWYFEVIRVHLPTILRMALLVLLVAAGFVYLLMVIRDYSPSAWSQLSSQERLLGLSTGCVVGAYLFFFQLGDEYIVIALPFLFILLGKQAQVSGWKQAVIVCLCVVQLAMAALWTRGTLETTDAYWQAAELLRGRGVPVDQIYNDAWEWTCYYKFEGYMRSRHNQVRSIGQYFEEWNREQKASADYFVTGNRVLPDEQTEVIDTVTFRDALFRKRFVYLLRKTRRS